MVLFLGDSGSSGAHISLREVSEEGLAKRLVWHFESEATSHEAPVHARVVSQPVPRDKISRLFSATRVMLIINFWGWISYRHTVYQDGVTPSQYVIEECDRVCMRKPPRSP